MTPEQRRRQLINRVYGNIGIENPNVTIELVTEQVDAYLAAKAKVEVEMANPYFIHPSHKMTEFRSTIVTITCTPRFGELRECEYCAAEHAKTVTGQAMHEELHTPCLCAPKATEQHDVTTT